MSYVTRPTLLLDMDGPLADFDNKFFRRCQEKGITMDCDGVHGQRHRFATDHIPDREERAWARRMVDTAGWFRDLPVTPGAQDGIDRLMEFFDVWICTKPLEANPTCRDDKAAWILENFGAYWLSRLIIAPDKSMVNGHLLLDDAPKSRWLESAPWRPIIFTTPWNQEGSPWQGFPHWSWGDPIEDLRTWALSSMI